MVGDADEKMTAECVPNDVFHPGAARYGNFINYYEFNPPENRLKLLSSDLITKLRSHSKIVAVDVGCNSGEMTYALYKSLLMDMDTPSTDCEVYMLGIDVDQTLIQRANEKNDHPDSISYVVCDIMNEESTQHLLSYLSRLDRPVFDVGFCLSLTMWIHLNHGDEGLVKFLLLISTLVKYLVIEPQPWKCYKSAVRRMRRLRQSDFPHFNTLKYRENVVEDIDKVLTRDCGMIQVKSLGESQWKRPILLYENPVPDR